MTKKMGINPKMFCVLSYIYCIVFIIFFTNADVLEKNFYMQSTSQTLKVISELPSQSDGHVYIASLKLFIQYLSENKKCVDFSMKFALFLLNVNLKSFIKEENLLPVSLRADIRYLTDQADMLQQIYDANVEEERAKHIPSEYDIDMISMYLSMLTNETRWSLQIFKLDLELLKEVYSYSYQFPNWEKYLSEVNDLAKWMPHLDLCNSCLDKLSKNNKTEIEGDLRSCQLSQECLEMLDYSNNFGYSLSFKLLFLILARLSQGCAVFSMLQDERIRHHLCKTAYRESEYIADNNYKKVDLMAEHISFCTLDGHAQFVRKSWISVLLDHQTPSGYFIPDLLMHEPANPDACYEHINAVVIGALSAAVRFVLENYH